MGSGEIGGGLTTGNLRPRCVPEREATREREEEQVRKGVCAATGNEGGSGGDNEGAGVI